MVFDTQDDAPISGTRAERYQIMLHVLPESLQTTDEPGTGARGSHEPQTGYHEHSTRGSHEPPLDSVLDDGTRVTPDTSRRLACDASVVCITHSHGGSILDVSRKTRSIPPALRRALEVRDRGCRLPECGRRFTDAHHVKHWADGGATNLGNCLLLCNHHHRLVHEGGWRIVWWGNRPVFIDAKGNEHFDGRWQPLSLGADAVDALVERHEQAGIVPYPWMIGARWRRERDIPADVYFRATETS